MSFVKCNGDVAQVQDAITGNWVASCSEAWEVTSTVYPRIELTMQQHAELWASALLALSVAYGLRMLRQKASGKG